ncbi:HAD family hydrolase [Janthinobacterium sp.]|uniref:HAD family hydrolase n=1 Tax=Janthinobacterium sp. TaxID=1871054 RepID=UPI00293D3370|nr:HAD family hydrolase [Janthinobacterium sp.]
MKKFLFVDLDDTLFQTPKKCAAELALEPAAYLKDGAPCSFTTPRQRAFLDFARRDMTLIPATARNADAFGRVGLPFASYAVLDYGGVVLQPGGALDAGWLELMRADMHLALPGLREAMRVIDDFQAALGRPARARLIEDYATPFYIVVKDHEAKGERLAEIEEQVLQPWVDGAGADFFIHRNGNNLALLPKTLNKARAVSYLRAELEAEHGPIVSFGMGDSRSDARFMAACDYAIIPSGTQLAALTVAAL